MSTFGGWMPEFPDIRVDFFRPIEGVRPPLACFLSHVHSDHLSGLESLKSPFIYCSVATKAILLRLERYPHRINFELGILESRKQRFQHLKNLLKPIPLETPTYIELWPGNGIQVTLFNANHCTGAVMFLIEGNGKAVIYTGDIRSEPWFVNTLRRNPFLIEYTTGLKTLDCIYLDTSFTDDIAFPTKADGLEELLQKISKYPSDTVFHFSAWTFGYEDVWIALSRALNSQVHVDSYKMRLYQTLRGESSGNERYFGSYLAPEAAALTGFMVGNTEHPGILTLNGNVKIHSCEKHLKCDYLNGRTVWIQPIIARTSSGQEIPEMGIGGGAGDLTRRPELELDNDAIIHKFFKTFANGEPSVMSEVQALLTSASKSSCKALSLNDMALDREMDELSLEGLAKVLIRSVTQKHILSATDLKMARGSDLPSVITFPYSRHSSYAELRALLKVFMPKDVYPCTVDKTSWHEAVSIEHLFGDVCSKRIFRHDCEMRAVIKEMKKLDSGDTQQSCTTCRTELSQEASSSEASSIEEKYKCNPGENQGILVQKPNGTIDFLELHRSFGIGSESGLFSRQSSTEGKEQSRLSDDSSDPISNLCPSELGFQRAPLLETSSSSQGSNLHNRRRKAVFEASSNNCRKRLRLQEEGSDASCDESSGAFCTNDDSNAHKPKVDGVPDVSYYDREHQVYRCEACGWEMWTPSGQCTGCGTGEPSYYEVFNSDPGTKKPGERDSFPRIAPSMDCRDEEIQSNLPSEMAFCYLDGISAYSSVSDSDKHQYEINSFTDDASIDNHSQERLPRLDDPSNANIHEQSQEISLNAAKQEVDYKHLPARLSRVFTRHIEEHDKLKDSRLDLRQEVFGSNDDDDNGHNVRLASEVRDPPVSEPILSQLQGDSQASAISPERLMTRVDAFLAMAHDEGEGWNNISLISTGDSHTEAEIEL